MRFVAYLSRFVVYICQISRPGRQGTMLIGYARVSTNEQRLDLQQDALRSAGCERIFTDTASGAKTERPGLAAALAACRAGDVLVVWR